MKRRAAILVFLSLMITAPAAFAQPRESAREQSEKGPSEGGGDTKTTILLWANFLVLAGGLGYLIVKNGGPFFAARARKIRREMVESGELRKEAEAEAAEVDRRLANLEKERAAMREESQREIEVQRQRVRQQTAAELAKIRAHAEQEIDAAGKSARAELKRYSAELAISLAEQKIRARLTPDIQDALVRGFVQNLDQPVPAGQSN
jgi:F-type H+-transporting ATPase subunit b